MNFFYLQDFDSVSYVFYELLHLQVFVASLNVASSGHLLLEIPVTPFSLIFIVPSYLVFL